MMLFRHDSGAQLTLRANQCSAHRHLREAGAHPLDLRPLAQTVARLPTEPAIARCDRLTECAVALTVRTEEAEAVAEAIRDVCEW